MKVLITGASGTLGRNVCKELKARGHQPVVYSRDRSRQLKYCPGTEAEVGDINDQATLRHVMKSHDVDSVVHCAAFKHVDVCETNPSVAINSIVNGTRNVLEVIESLGNQIKHSVIVSSDKACQRDQTYGICKYLTEQLTREYGKRIPGKINSVRFGNLLGSEGSVLPIWYEKLKKGENITLRMFGPNPGLRFMMLPSEAAKVAVSVLMTDELKSGTVVCPLGVPTVNMGQLANAVIDLVNPDLGIDRVDALPGEKEFEMLYDEEESESVTEVWVSEDSRVYEIDRNDRRYKGIGFLGTIPAFVSGTDDTLDLTKKAIGEMLSWT